MLFCSQPFILFFLAVFVAYWLTPWQRTRVYLLLAASFFFYATWNRWLALLIVASSTIDYCIARSMDGTDRPGRRKWLLALSVCFNLGVLCYFKYANFFLHSLEEALRGAGLSPSFPVLRVILPVGISFYTFEAISYSVDVYRRKIRAERDLACFLLFILFFPHLVAGPIVRGSDFLPQIRRKKRWNWARINVGLQLFLLGVFKKIGLGDRLAGFVDIVYADPSSYSAPVLWLAVGAFAVQLYCDFSGYSDMALGAAHLLGYRLAPNFNLPFLAANISDFWRRWHMTLSSWIRDYVYISLGGSRGAAWFTYRNLLIAMTLCGLWHGASWNFILFGFSQGLCLVAYHGFRNWSQDRPSLRSMLESSAGVCFSTALTFLAFSLSLVFFRAETFSKAATIFQGLFSGNSLGPLPAVNYLNFTCLFIIVAIGHWMAQGGRWRRLLDAMPAEVVGAGYSLMATAALVLAPGLAKTFVYFQF